LKPLHLLSIGSFTATAYGGLNALVANIGVASIVNLIVRKTATGPFSSDTWIGLPTKE
ncbi:MAG: hypothetical protein JWQ94_1310, partial [Tardiphaga sp.]|nr:hypothetical protein [Tardiphaga sp.]